ncbi:Ldh family oxidoreductase [Ramlibacter sp. MAHUQ-53]|uniref:Ldh family oxidoreductase n=1 Tax=unclassified Ramlibacter TaxID=2617605 RepID=UPI00363C2511
MAEGRIPVAQLARFIARVLETQGLPAADAATVGRLMAQAEAQGSDGHGAIRLAPYVRRIRAGGYNLTPDIRVTQERVAMALLDGDNGFGHLVMEKAARLAIEKARHCGIAWVGSHHSNHAGPASLYARMALEHDMVALYFAVGNANHLPPWGGLDMLLSTNPIAVAVPAGEEAPIVLDMATTVAAYGKVKAKAQRGEQMPVGWMIDRQGQPLTDPTRSEEGFLMPIGGYKGYGLALVVGLLAGTLNGAAMGRQVIDFNKDYQTTTNTGQAIAVIDPAAFGDVAAFKARVDQVIREMRASERMPGVDRIWLPGEQSHARRLENEQLGIALPAALRAQLDALAAEVGAPSLAQA